MPGSQYRHEVWMDSALKKFDEFVKYAVLSNGAAIALTLTVWKSDNVPLAFSEIQFSVWAFFSGLVLGGFSKLLLAWSDWKLADAIGERAVSDLRQRLNQLQERTNSARVVGAGNDTNLESHIEHIRDEVERIERSIKKKRLFERVPNNLIQNVGVGCVVLAHFAFLIGGIQALTSL